MSLPNRASTKIPKTQTREHRPKHVRRRAKERELEISKGITRKAQMKETRVTQNSHVWAQRYTTKWEPNTWKGRQAQNNAKTCKCKLKQRCKNNASISMRQTLDKPKHGPMRAKESSRTSQNKQKCMSKWTIVDVSTNTCASIYAKGFVTKQEPNMRIIISERRCT